MPKKKPLEIECPECKIKFRLWIPEDLFSNWKDGEEIGCIKCGAHIILEKEEDSFRVKSKQKVKTIVTPGKTSETFEAAGAVILIVDDDGLVRKMAENVLKKNKLMPLTAKNGQEALDIIKKDHVALVVVDLHLKNPKDPESIMDGEEFLQKLVDSGKNIPAIVTTGKDLIDDIIFEPKWYDLHVMAFIQKGSPSWTDDLLVKIKEALNRD